MLVALVLGYVANLVAHLSNARKQFQSNLDSVKSYMRKHRVPEYLQMKVIRWFDYLWLTHQAGEQSDALHALPDRLKGEIAIQVHLNTLKRVEIFRNTEPGFLCELVLLLKPQLFSPGDYVCRRGEVGKEMYIVNRGKLRVLNDDQGTVLATLTAGAYFGEISLLNVGSEGNRRTASVLSTGYSELLCLSKKEIWEVLEDYPTARERLEEIARRRLEEAKGVKELLGKKLSVASSTGSVGRRASAPVICNTGSRSARLFSAPNEMNPGPGRLMSVMESPSVLDEEHLTTEDGSEVSYRLFGARL